MYSHFDKESLIIDVNEFEPKIILKCAHAQFKTNITT